MAISPADTQELFANRTQVPWISDPAQALNLTQDRAAQGAPYLKALLQEFPDSAALLETQSPEHVVAALCAPPPDDNLASLSQTLRQRKKQIHLICALCDIAGVWDWDPVTRTLSDFTDMAMTVLFAATARELGFTPNERGPVPGLFVLAIG